MKRGGSRGISKGSKLNKKVVEDEEEDEVVEEEQQPSEEELEEEGEEEDEGAEEDSKQRQQLGEEEEEEDEELPPVHKLGRGSRGGRNGGDSMDCLIDENMSVLFYDHDEDDASFEEHDGHDDDDGDHLDDGTSKPVRGRGSGGNHSRSRRSLRAMCASIKKMCSKRPIEGRLYCIKHILEDQTAPFAQCEFVSSKSMKRCTAPVSLSESTPRYCPSHKHIVEAQLQKKRILEDSNTMSSSQSKRLLAILAKHGINKGNYYQDYKEKNPKRLKLPNPPAPDEIAVADPAATMATTSTTTTSTTTTTSSMMNSNSHMDASRYYKTVPMDLSLKSQSMFDTLIDQKEDNDWHLCDDFNEDFYLAQASLLSEEELIQRRKIYISKLILLYKKQYARIKERLRILRRHYLDSVLISQQQQQQNQEKQQDQFSTPSESIDSCIHSKCKANPLPLSKYCFTHIMDDKQQKLFTGCTYQLINESRCGFPILKTQVPDLCCDHLDVISQQDTLFINGKTPKKKQLKSLLQQQAQQLKSLPPNTHMAISNNNTPLKLSISEQYSSNHLTAPILQPYNPSVIQHQPTLSSVPSSPLFKSTPKVSKQQSTPKPAGKSNQK